MVGRSPTIVDVARAAGVSTATVSRALNGGLVSDRAHARVIEAVSTLGYRPNVVARGLVTGRTGVIGVLVPDVAGPLYAQMARGIEDVTEPLGMQFLMLTDDRAPELEREAIDVLLERKVDGLVLIGSRLASSRLREQVRGTVPVVMVEREGDETDFTTVSVDNEAGARAATEHLIAQGHQRIAHVAGIRRAGRLRLRGYCEAMRAAGLAEGPIVQGDFTEESGVRAGEELEHHRGVTAVFCSNDRVALGLYSSLAARGASVPRDLSVVGFDDLPWSPYLTPPLTTVRHGARAMGRAAAAELVAAVGGATTRRAITIPTHVVVRSSVAPRPEGRRREVAHP